MKEVTKKQQRTAEFIFKPHPAACAETINAVGKATRKARAILIQEAHDLGIDFIERKEQ